MRFDEPWDYKNWTIATSNQDVDIVAFVATNKSRRTERNEARGRRIVQCVNALAGVSDPEAFIDAADAVFKEFYGANATILPIALAAAIQRLRAARGQQTGG